MAKDTTDPKSEIISAVREDSKYKKFKAILLKTQEKLRIDADRNEALALHTSRTSRSLHGKKLYSPTALVDAAAHDMSCRSRLVEIRIQCHLQISLMQEAVKAIKRHINTEYYEELGRYKTVGQRSALIDRIVASAIDTVSEGQALIDFLDTIIKDIDQASYSLSTMKDMLKLLAEVKGKIV